MNDLAGRLYRAICEALERSEDLAEILGELRAQGHSVKIEALLYRQVQSAEAPPVPELRLNHADERFLRSIKVSAE